MKGLLIMGNAPIVRVKDNPRSAQLAPQRVEG
jgi:hypothetical protein